MHVSSYNTIMIAITFMLLLLKVTLLLKIIIIIIIIENLAKESHNKLTVKAVVCLTDEIYDEC